MLDLKCFVAMALAAVFPVMGCAHASQSEDAHLKESAAWHVKVETEESMLLNLINAQHEFKYEALYESTSDSKSKSRHMTFSARLSQIEGTPCTLDYARTFRQDGAVIMEGKVPLKIGETMNVRIQSTAEAMSANLRSSGNASWRVTKVSPPAFTLVVEFRNDDPAFFMFTSQSAAQSVLDQMRRLTKSCGAL
jgi:hypothetical protein